MVQSHQSSRQPRSQPAQPDVPPSPSTAPAGAPLDAGAWVLRWAEAHAFSSVPVLREFLLTKEDGSVVEPPPAAFHEAWLGERTQWKVDYQKTTKRQAREQRRRVEELSLDIALTDPARLTALLAHLHALKQDAEVTLGLVRDEITALTVALSSRPWWSKFGRRRSTGEVATDLLKAASESPERSEQQTTLRRRQLDEAVLQRIIQLLAALEVAVEARSVAQHQLRAVIEGAVALLTADLEALEQTAVQSELPNDQPAGYLRPLADALATEPAAQARVQLLRLLRGVLLEAEQAGEELTAEQLAERVLATAAPAEAALPASLQSALRLVAAARGFDVRWRWKKLLGHLGGPAFGASPTVALLPAELRTAETFTFQVLPAGQPAAVAGERTELRHASFEPGGVETRLAILQVHTNFPLTAVAAVRELEPQLAEAVAEANPFLLPARVTPTPPPPEDGGTFPAPGGPVPDKSGITAVSKETEGLAAASANGKGRHVPPTV